jgi:hypothetical protein
MNDSECSLLCKLQKNYITYLFTFFCEFEGRNKSSPWRTLRWRKVNHQIKQL